MRERLLRDTILMGFLIGAVSIMVDYIVLFYVDKLFFNISDMGHVLKFPRLQAIVLAMNIVLFRFMIVKWKKTEAGKGLFLSIVIITAWYIYKYKKSVL
ncbi:MAG: hypothetical protein ABI772_01180 [Bacteroidota bacterium]